MVNPDVHNFIKSALAQGKTKEEITSDLAKGGWNQAEIDEAYTAIKDTPPPSPSSPSAGGKSSPTAPLLCPYCHQPVLPQYYYCPNCGNKLSEAALSTTLLTQAWIYAFSIALPIICFLAVTKWPGLKYYRSKDPKAKLIGIIAWTLLILSTLVTLWLAYVWTQQAIQSTESGIDADLSPAG
jgi:hypothetical protein